jgi:hypothetical protein
VLRRGVGGPGRRAGAAGPRAPPAFPRGPLTVSAGLLAPFPSRAARLGHPGALRRFEPRPIRGRGGPVRRPSPYRCRSVARFAPRGRNAAPPRGRFPLIRRASVPSRDAMLLASAEPPGCAAAGCRDGMLGGRSQRVAPGGAGRRGARGAGLVRGRPRRSLAVLSPCPRGVDPSVPPLHSPAIRGGAAGAPPFWCPSGASVWAPCQVRRP